MEVKTHNFFETSLNPKLTGDSGSNFRPGEYKIVVNSHDNVLKWVSKTVKIFGDI